MNSKKSDKYNLMAEPRIVGYIDDEPIREGDPRYKDGLLNDEGAKFIRIVDEDHPPLKFEKFGKKAKITDRELPPQFEKK